MAGYKQPYTTEEEKKILSFIINNQGFHKTRGRQFWQELEESGIINRTWQSTKEHFLKQVYPNLQNPKFQLNDQEIQLIRTGYIESSNNNLSKSSKINNFNPTSENPNTVDLSVIVDSSDEEI